jgi:hypothetical protein
MKYNPKPEMPKIERRANPEYKEEYEMPAEYQEQAKQLVELIESRDEYARMMPTMPPELYREAKPHYDKLNASVEELEEKMAYEYERYQEEQRLDQELYEMTWLQDLMSEELFIKVKHQRPHIFEGFEKYATKGMTDAEREEQFAIIARRETEELEDILSGEIPLPEDENLFIKHRLPDPWIAELLLQITKIAYQTDSFFEINFDALERLDKTRREFCFRNQRALPVRRRNMEEAILDMKQTLGAGRRFLLDYIPEAISAGKFVLLDEGYTEYLDSYLNSLEGCIYTKYVVIKLTMPERLDEYVRIVTEDFSPAEVEAFLTRAAEAVEKSTRALTDSLEKERIANERVEARRGAPDYRKIDGPELSERNKNQMLLDRERREKREQETPPVKIEHDLPAIFKRYLKVLYAVTDGGGYAPARYEDEQSRKDEELDKILDDMQRNSEKLYVIVKHHTPHLFEEFHKICTDHLSPYELAEFQKNIAHLEATQLDELLKTK